MENSRFKFRAWDVERKRMVFFTSLSVCWFYEDDYRIEAGENEKSNLGRGGIVHDDFLEEIPESHIMQCVGLKDKNGTEIYEGDIVHQKTLLNGFEAKGYVVYKEPSFQVQVTKAGFGEGGWLSSFETRVIEYEVIGNIHENPELLEEEKN